MISDTESGGKRGQVSNYNALAAELRRSFSGGMSFSVNYVWSKSLDALNNGANTPQNAHDIAAEYGPSDFNPGQTFKASGVFQLPFGAGRPYLGRDNWFNRQVIWGWQSSGIFSVQSGLPFSASASDLSQTGAYHSLRANQTCNGNNPQNQSFSHWFDTSCFTQPGTGQFGDERRDNLTGPRNTNLNLSLFKSFPIKEGTSLQFRTDLVDALNHPLPENPSSNVANARTFGVISSIPGSRTIQFALKFIY